MEYHFTKKYMGDKYVYYHDAKAILQKCFFIIIIIIIKAGCHAVQTQFVWKQIKGAVEKKRLRKHQYP